MRRRTGGAAGRRGFLLAGAALAGGGCGLFELASWKSIRFSLPAQSYKITTNDARFSRIPPGGVPTLTCGSGGIVQNCCNPPAPAAAFDCARFPLSCEAGSCAVSVPYEEVSKVNLADQVPELKQTRGEIISDVRLTAIDLDIANDMNVALPAVQLYIGPQDATGPSSPRTRLLGTLGSKAAGFRGPDRIELTAEAQQAFSQAARDFQSPFTLIMATRFVVNGGTPIPQGQLTLTVSGQVEARL